MSSRYIKSWKGLETSREQIRAIAHRVTQTDSIVRGMYRSSVATGLICEAMNDISKASSPDIAEAAKAQNELFLLHNHLVQDMHLDFDFVRREWATIMDPSDQEKSLCDSLI